MCKKKQQQQQQQQQQNSPIPLSLLKEEATFRFEEKGSAELKNSNALKLQ